MDQPCCVMGLEVDIHQEPNVRKEDDSHMSQRNVASREFSTSVVRELATVDYPELPAPIRREPVTQDAALQRRGASRLHWSRRIFQVLYSPSADLKAVSSIRDAKLGL